MAMGLRETARIGREVVAIGHQMEGRFRLMDDRFGTFLDVVSCRESHGAAWREKRPNRGSPSVTLKSESPGWKRARARRPEFSENAPF